MLFILKPETLQTKLQKRIARKQGDVFLRADFEDLGGYGQVGRVLRDLVRKGQPIKLGYPHMNLRMRTLIFWQGYRDACWPEAEAQASRELCKVLEARKKKTPEQLAWQAHLESVRRQQKAQDR